jgi:hypothetical protein
MAGRSTVRAALATVEAADAAASLVDLPGLLRPEPMTAFGADSAQWTELDKTAGPLPSRVVAYPEPLLDHEAARALEQHAPGFPLTRHTRPGGDSRPVRPREDAAGRVVAGDLVTLGRPRAGVPGRPARRGGDRPRPTWT